MLKEILELKRYLVLFLFYLTVITIPVNAGTISIAVPPPPPPSPPPTPPAPTVTAPPPASPAPAVAPSAPAPTVASPPPTIPGLGGITVHTPPNINDVLVDEVGARASLNLKLLTQPTQINDEAVTHEQAHQNTAHVHPILKKLRHLRKRLASLKILEEQDRNILERPRVNREKVEARLAKNLDTQAFVKSEIVIHEQGLLRGGILRSN